MLGPEPEGPLTGIIGDCAPETVLIIDDEQKRDRDQRYRDTRAEASTEYLADIASDGPDCEDD